MIEEPYSLGKQGEGVELVVEEEVDGVLGQLQGQTLQEGDVVVDKLVVTGEVIAEANKLIQERMPKHVDCIRLKHDAYKSSFNQ